LTALYVAALRANGIPARQLVGRWAQSAKKNEMLYGKPWQQEHIKSEFYAGGIGWVPVDVSVAVDYDKKPGSLKHFGDDPGNFLTFHFDADLMLDVPVVGKKPIRFMQEPAYFFEGRGSLEGAVIQSDWVVEGTRGRR
jgi:transglutaminase-like putative cysteine protease